MITMLDLQAKSGELKGLVRCSSIHKSDSPISYYCFTDYPTN